MGDSIRYRPSGRVETIGLALAAAISLTGAATLGLANGFISSPVDNLVLDARQSAALLARAVQRPTTS